MKNFWGAINLENIGYNSLQQFKLYSIISCVKWWAVSQYISYAFPFDINKMGHYYNRESQILYGEKFWRNSQFLMSTHYAVWAGIT